MARTRFQRKHDTIFFYGRKESPYFSPEGASRPVAPEHVGRYNKIDEHGSRYARVKNRDGSYSDIYLKDVVREDWWNIPFVRGKEVLGYPTQKPIALLSVIVESSTKPSDVILDPFCGCATTLAAADSLKRNWAGIDISPKAAELVVRRIADQQGLFRQITHRKDIPKRTDLGKLPPYNSDANRKILYGEQGGYCAGCQTHFEARHLEIDHIIAKQKGGTDHLENLQLLCGNCNRIKGNRGMEYLKTKLQL